jgi:hypothetical protein
MRRILKRVNEFASSFVASCDGLPLPNLDLKGSFFVKNGAFLFLGYGQVM